MNAKVLILILVVLLALYLAGTALGLRQRSRPTPERPAPPAWVSGLFGWARPGFDLDSITIAGKRVTQRRLPLPAGGRIELRIAPADALARTLTLDFGANPPEVWFAAKDPGTGDRLVMDFDQFPTFPSEAREELLKARPLVPNREAEGDDRRRWSWAIPAQGGTIVLRSFLDRERAVELR